MVTGAIPALKGFSRQILYTLDRLVTHDAKLGASFRPEHLEDLAIFDSKGELQEAIQVKALGEPLTLSSLEPQKQESFLKRAIDLAARYPTAQIKLVSYGPIGPELDGAWQGRANDKERVRRKLINHGYSVQDICHLFERLILQESVETAHEKAIYEFLKRNPIIAGQPERAYELLTYWIYRASERQEQLTHQGRPPSSAT